MPIEDKDFSELLRQVSVIDSKLDMLIKSQDKQYADHETRIRTLEKAYWIMFGAYTIITAVAAYLSRVL